MVLEEQRSIPQIEVKCRWTKMTLPSPCMPLWGNVPRCRWIGVVAKDRRPQLDAAELLARRIVSELNTNTPLPLHQTLTHNFYGSSLKSPGTRMFGNACTTPIKNGPQQPA